MLMIFQRFHREICLVLLVLFGLACAHLATTLLEMKLQFEAPPMPVPKTTTSVQQSGRQLEDLNFILRHNLFNPGARGQGMGPGRRDANAERQPVLDRKDLILFGTMVAGDDSVALIKVKRDIDLFRLDQELPDGGRIESIERNRVTIRNDDGTSSVLGLEEDVVRRPAAARKSAVDSGIVAVSKNRWKVTRRAAQDARENIAGQLRLALMEPRITNGKTDGFVIKRLDRRSLLVDMGILRGDVIKTVNDMKLDSPEKALQIMQQLREARSITVDIERFGKPMTFTYELE